MKELLKSLLQGGYKLTEIYKMKLKDIDLLLEVLETEIKEPEPELTTLDKAFPFLFQ